MKIPRALISGAAAIILIMSMAQSRSEAGFVTTVTPTVTTQPGGTFLYSYSVANDVSSTVGIFEFNVAVSTGSMLSQLTAPSGFLSLYTSGDFAVQFLSSDGSSDVAPGFTGVFSFISPLAPGFQSSLTRGFDDAGGVLFANAGTTLAPVPEPSTLALFAAGAVVLSIASAVKRRK